MNECYFCKGKTTNKMATVDFRWGSKLVVIENVPAEVCCQCGEKYYDAKVSRQMETIALSNEKPRHTINIPVCEFAGV